MLLSQQHHSINVNLFSRSIAGPAFWGLINPEWSLCNKGRRQSPVNLEPQRLLFDPNLRPLHIDKHRVSLVFNLVEPYLIFMSNKSILVFNEFLSASTWKSNELIASSCIPLQISGTIANTGHSVIFTADNDTIYNSYGSNSNSMSGMSNSNMQISNQTPVNLTGGPLSYRYRFHEIHIHYGLHDQFGSEHSVEGYTFPAEVNRCHRV